MYRYRVLVVDDEPEVLEILSIALREKYDIVTAVNGLDALEKLDDFEPDLTVTDVMMPLMNGWELITEIRKRPPFAHMPVIFLTALNSRKDIMAGYKAGADLYLTKPFDPLRVRKNIDVFIEKTPPPQRQRLHSWSDLQEQLRRKARGEDTKRKPSPPPQRAEEPEEKAPEHDVTPRLFVVDDDEELLEVLRLRFEDEFEVFTCADGLDAVKRIPDYQPDIFVIDGMLPRMTGYQLCDTLRRSSAYRSSPIVFISAKADPKTRDTMKRFNLVDYLAKPFESEELAGILHRILKDPEFEPRLKKFNAEELMLEQEKEAEERKKKEKVKELKESKSKIKEFVQEHQEE